MDIFLRDEKKCFIFKKKSLQMVLFVLPALSLDDFLICQHSFDVNISVLQKFQYNYKNCGLTPYFDVVVK